MSRDRSDGGFTLFELLVVGAIILAMGFAVTPYTRAFLAARGVNGTGGGLVRLASLAQRAAVDSQADVFLRSMPDSRYAEVFVPAAEVDGEKPEEADTGAIVGRSRIARDATVSYEPLEGAVAPETTVVTGASNAVEPEWNIPFHPDGSCDGGSITVTGRRGEECRITLDAVTGDAVVGEAGSDA